MRSWPDCPVGLVDVKGRAGYVARNRTIHGARRLSIESPLRPLASLLAGEGGWQLVVECTCAPTPAPACPAGEEGLEAACHAWISIAFEPNPSSIACQASFTCQQAGEGVEEVIKSTASKPVGLADESSSS